MACGGALLRRESKASFARVCTARRASMFPSRLGEPPRRDRARLKVPAR
jgi:hypothetical protein